MVIIPFSFSTVTRRQNAVISTGVSIPAMYWDKRACVILPSLPVEYGMSTTLQEIVDKQRTKAERIITYETKKILACPMQFLKRNFRLPDCWDLEQLEEDNNNLSVFYQIERYLDDKKNDGTARHNNRHQNHEETSARFYGNSKIKLWQYHQRKIYSESDYFINSQENYEPYEILHEFAFHYSEEKELFFIMAIMGIEYSINMAEPEIDTYITLLKKKGNKSFLNRDYENRMSYW